jgi:hypothetical protein
MNQPAPSAPAPQAIDQEKYNQLIALAALQRRAKVGANNFYWIGALSIINSIISIFNGSLYFVVGLGATLFVDVVAAQLASQMPEIGTLARAFGLILSLVISGIFGLFGYLAGKGQRWAFLAGMVAYGLDAILMLAFQEWIGFLFHLYFLWGLWNGLRALNRLQKLMPARPTDFPQSIGTA